MMNEKVDIEIAKRRMTVEMEGLTPMQITHIANQVNEKMAESAAQLGKQKIFDSSKIAIMTALELAADRFNERNAHKTERDYVEGRIEHITLVLRTALAAAGRGE